MNKQQKFLLLICISSHLMVLFTEGGLEKFFVLLTLIAFFGIGFIGSEKETLDTYIVMGKFPKNGLSNKENAKYEAWGYGHAIEIKNYLNDYYACVIVYKEHEIFEGEKSK